MSESALRLDEQVEDAPLATLDAEIATLARVALSSETPSSREEFDELRKTRLRPSIRGASIALDEPALLDRFDELTNEELLALVRDDEERLATDLAEKAKQMPKPDHARLFSHLSAQALHSARRIDGVRRLIRDVRAPRVQARAREQKPTADTSNERRARSAF